MSAPHPAQVTRPANLARNLLHFSSGLTALLVLQLAPNRAWVVAMGAGFFALAWTLEYTRRQSGQWNNLLMRILGPFAHKHERTEVNSATWYSTALFVIALFGNLMAASVAVMVLGAADPIAAQVGQRWGKVRLTTNRTLEGTLAFFVAGTAIAAATLLVCYPALNGVQTVLFSLVAGVAGAIAELVSRRIDDNLSIPLATTAAVMAAALLVR